MPKLKKPRIVEGEVCWFCKQPEVEGSWQGLGKLCRTKDPVADGHYILYHEPCAVFSNGSGAIPEEGMPDSEVLRFYEHGEHCYNVGLKCELCKKRGATVGCCHGPCPRTYHFPCARLAALNKQVTFSTHQRAMACGKHLKKLSKPWEGQYLGLWMEGLGGWHAMFYKEAEQEWLPHQPQKQQEVEQYYKTMMDLLQKDAKDAKSKGRKGGRTPAVKKPEVCETSVSTSPRAGPVPPSFDMSASALESSSIQQRPGSGGEPHQVSLELSVGCSEQPGSLQETDAPNIGRVGMVDSEMKPSGSQVVAAGLFKQASTVTVESQALAKEGGVKADPGASNGDEPVDGTPVKETPQHLDKLARLCAHIQENGTPSKPEDVHWDTPPSSSMPPPAPVLEPRTCQESAARSQSRQEAVMKPGAPLVVHAHRKIEEKADEPEQGQVQLSGSPGGAAAAEEEEGEEHMDLGGGGVVKAASLGAGAGDVTDVLGDGEDEEKTATAKTAHGIAPVAVDREGLDLVDHLDSDEDEEDDQNDDEDEDDGQVVEDSDAEIMSEDDTDGEEAGERIETGDVHKQRHKGKDGVPSAVRGEKVGKPRRRGLGLHRGIMTRRTGLHRGRTLRDGMQLPSSGLELQLPGRRSSKPFLGVARPTIRASGFGVVSARNQNRGSKRGGRGRGRGKRGGVTSFGGESQDHGGKEAEMGTSVLYSENKSDEPSDDEAADTSSPAESASRGMEEGEKARLAPEGAHSPTPSNSIVREHDGEAGRGKGPDATDDDQSADLDDGEEVEGGDENDDSDSGGSEDAGAIDEMDEGKPAATASTEAGTNLEAAGARSGAASPSPSPYWNEEGGGATGADDLTSSSDSDTDSEDSEEDEDDEADGEDHEMQEHEGEGVGKGHATHAVAPGDEVKAAAADHYEPGVYEDKDGGLPREGPYAAGGGEAGGNGQQQGAAEGGDAELGMKRKLPANSVGRQRRPKRLRYKGRFISEKKLPSTDKPLPEPKPQATAGAKSFDGQPLMQGRRSSRRNLADGSDEGTGGLSRASRARRPPAWLVNESAEIDPLVVKLADAPPPPMPTSAGKSSVGPKKGPPFKGKSEGKDLVRVPSAKLLPTSDQGPRRPSGLPPAKHPHLLMQRPGPSNRYPSDRGGPRPRGRPYAHASPARPARPSPRPPDDSGHRLEFLLAALEQEEVEGEAMGEQEEMEEGEGMPEYEVPGSDGGGPLPDGQVPVPETAATSQAPQTWMSRPSADYPLNCEAPPNVAQGPYAPLVNLPPVFGVDRMEWEGEVPEDLFIPPAPESLKSGNGDGEWQPPPGTLSATEIFHKVLGGSKGIMLEAEALRRKGAMSQQEGMEGQTEAGFGDGRGENIQEAMEFFHRSFSLTGRSGASSMEPAVEGTGPGGSLHTAPSDAAGMHANSLEAPVNPEDAQGGSDGATNTPELDEPGKPGGKVSASGSSSWWKNKKSGAVKKMAKVKPAITPSSGDKREQPQPPSRIRPAANNLTTTEDGTYKGRHSDAALQDWSLFSNTTLPGTKYRIVEAPFCPLLRLEPLESSAGAQKFSHVFPGQQHAAPHGLSGTPQISIAASGWGPARAEPTYVQTPAPYDTGVLQGITVDRSKLVGGRWRSEGTPGAQSSLQCQESLTGHHDPYGYAAPGGALPSRVVLPTLGPSPATSQAMAVSLTPTSEVGAARANWQGGQDPRTDAHVEAPCSGQQDTGSELPIREALMRLAAATGAFVKPGAQEFTPGQPPLTPQDGHQNLGTPRAVTTSIGGAYPGPLHHQQSIDSASGSVGSRQGPLVVQSGSARTPVIQEHYVTPQLAAAQPRYAPATQEVVRYAHGDLSWNIEQPPPQPTLVRLPPQDGALKYVTTSLPPHPSHTSYGAHIPPQARPQSYLTTQQDATGAAQEVTYRVVDAAPRVPEGTTQHDGLQMYSEHQGPLPYTGAPHPERQTSQNSQSLKRSLEQAAMGVNVSGGVTEGEPVWKRAALPFIPSVSMGSDPGNEAARPLSMGHHHMPGQTAGYLDRQNATGPVTPMIQTMPAPEGYQRVEPTASHARVMVPGYYKGGVVSMAAGSTAYQPQGQWFNPQTTQEAYTTHNQQVRVSETHEGTSVPYILRNGEMVRFEQMPAERGLAPAGAVRLAHQVTPEMSRAPLADSMVMAAPSQLHYPPPGAGVPGSSGQRPYYLPASAPPTSGLAPAPPVSSAGPIPPLAADKYSHISAALEKRGLTAQGNLKTDDSPSAVREYSAVEFPPLHQVLPKRHLYSGYVRVSPPIQEGEVRVCGVTIHPSVGSRYLPQLMNLGLTGNKILVSAPRATCELLNTHQLPRVHMCESVEAYIRRRRKFTGDIATNGLPDDLPEVHVQATTITQEDPRVALRGRGALRTNFSVRKGCVIGLYRSYVMYQHTFLTMLQTPPAEWEKFKPPSAGGWPELVCSYTVEVEEEWSVKGAQTDAGDASKKLYFCSLGYGNLTALVNDPNVDPQIIEEGRHRVSGNSAVVVFLVNGLPVPFLVALKDIDAGQEVTYDYGEEYWRNISICRASPNE